MSAVQEAAYTWCR